MKVLSNTKSKQYNTSKRTRLHQSFKNTFGEHAPEPPNISVADVTIYFYTKNSHFYSELVQNINQIASIVVFSKSSLGGKHPYSKYVTIIFIYKNMLTLKHFSRHNLIKIYTKMHQYFLYFLGGTSICP